MFVLLNQLHLIFYLNISIVIENAMYIKIKLKTYIVAYWLSVVNFLLFLN